MSRSVASLSREMKIAGNKEFSMSASSACAGTPPAPVGDPDLDI